MVTNVTSLTGNGLKDWIIQRASAIYFALYCFFIIGFLFANPAVTHADFLALFKNTYFKIATIIALFALLLHSWIGIWTVTTDYIKCTALRLTVQGLVALVLLGQMIWGIMIFWGL